MIGLIGRVAYLSGIFGDDDRWIVFSELSTLFFGTTVYLFTVSSLRHEAFDKRRLKHYIFPLFYNAGVVITFIVLANQAKPFWLVMTFIGVGLTVNISYFVASVKVFLKFKRRLQHEYSDAIKTNFFAGFLICIGLCMSCWLVMYILGMVDAYYINRTSWQVIWFSIAIIILFLAYHSIQDPELFRIELPLVEQTKYAHSKYSAKDLDELKEKLDQIMQLKKPYLNRKLYKSELAELLGVSHPEMARLLNERIGMSFFEYVNYFRIKEFIELAKTEKAKELTLFGLAQEAGFNSKTTFNKSFKQIMGSTPTAYFKSS